PWEIGHSEHLFPIRYGGKVDFHTDPHGILRARWNTPETVMAMAYDILIPGYANKVVNTLRLWSAKSSRDFNLVYFNEGDYINSVADKNHSEMISKVLYPKDDTLQGKELRLKQEYFFVSATIQDILRRFFKKHSDLNLLPDKVAIQLNDTHPAVAIADLMRILVDEKSLPWDKAWEISSRTFAYTNHTILPEALETWNVDLLGTLLPRHLQIIYEINHRFLNSIKLPSSNIEALSLIQEHPVKAVRMANLAIHGSHSINGVSALHTELLKTRIFPHFYALSPEKFNNKTNGITPRRWLKLANPRLSELICDAIGDKWIRDLDELKKLESFVNDSTFCERWRQVKHENKQDFSEYLKKTLRTEVSPDSIFDFQTKRIHEYKRQLLNALHIIHLGLRILDSKKNAIQPHTFFFAGKAAPGYFMAKLIIKFITSIGDWIEREPKLRKSIKVVFLPNYRVTLAEKIMPAADLSQQISMAGTEASGTGNMKFAINGALTVGTLDGANIEILEAVGDTNIFIFGNTAEQIDSLKKTGYNPNTYIEADKRIAQILDLISQGHLSSAEPGLFAPILAELSSHGDTYCNLADFDSYTKIMSLIDKEYGDQVTWTKKSILNVANMGRFSSDKVIQNYAREIWCLEK
ncbi:MAG: glycogen/starch/alpha-glucan phosphorylase, partial [Candidatus Cloacimonetes bacterium]|nr:glycogen/starch/alpha-glucan phosphorylase [Candidatus Cloacimonadota bacterium]